MTNRDPNTKFNRIITWLLVIFTISGIVGCLLFIILKILGYPVYAP